MRGELRMTFREKLAQEHPGVAASFPGGYRGCPADYGYEKPGNAPCYDAAFPDPLVPCADCWDREMPENDPQPTQRISKNLYYLHIAKAVSERSTCLKRQYGAVIVKNDEIIATGYNGAPRGEENCCDLGVCKRMDKPHNSGDYADCHSVHAEQNAIISASRRDMLGATLYLWGGENGKAIDAEPCPICARLIKNAGIDTVICRDEETLTPL